MATAQLEVVPDRFGYDPELHIYTIDNNEVPSVTQVIKPISPFFGEPGYAAELGDVVHQTCALYSNGELDEWTVDPVVAPYLESWKGFLKAMGDKLAILAIEKRLYDERLRCAGTLDYFVRLKNRPAILDVKSGVSVGPEVGVQLAGYAMLSANVPAAGYTIDRYAVHVTPDGEPARLIPFRDLDDLTEFRSLLNHYWWRKNHGK